MNNRVFIAVLIAVSLLATACPKRVTINGVTYNYEDAAKAAYDDAQATRAQGDTEGALKKLDTFMAQFAESSLADDALLAIGQLSTELKQLERARQAYGRLAMDYPTSPHAVKAQLGMARIDVQLGRGADAIAPLRAVYDKLDNTDDKQEVALSLATILDQEGQNKQAVEWYLKALANARSQQEQAEIQKRVFNMVDSGLSFQEVRYLAETTDLSSPAGELLLFKLARIYCHLRDFRQCSETVASYLQSHPRGQFVVQAQELQQRLQARLAVNPTVIGVVLPLSGKYKIYGERTLFAIQSGAEVLGTENKGGVDLVVRDSQGKPDVAAKMVEELALKEHAIVIIGAILQNTAAAAALKAEELSVPLISFSRREGLAEFGPYVFRYGLTNSKQAKALVDLTMGRLKMTRFAILYPRHSYGTELMNAFWDEVERRKGYIVGAEAYDHDQTTFIQPIKKLTGRSPMAARGEYSACVAKARAQTSGYAQKKAKERCESGLTPLVDFEALLIPDDHKAVGLIAPALAFEDVLLATGDKEAIRDYRKTTGNKKIKPVQLIGANGWNQANLVERGGNHVQGCLFVDGFHPDSSEPHVQKFVQMFAASGKGRPTVIDAQAYDGAKLAATLVRGGVQPAPKSRDEMRGLLAGAKSFPGVTGVTSFDEKGDSVTPLPIFTIDDETIQIAEIEEEGQG